MKRNQYKFSLFLLLLLLWISGKSEVIAGNCAQGEHEYRPYVVRHADGETDGIREYICIECGDGYTEIIPKTGHDFSVYYVEQEPDCANEGVGYWLCADCGKREYEILAFTEEHRYGEWGMKLEPTCIAAGIRTQVCEACGEVRVEEMEPTGIHTYEQTIYPASCTEEGKKVFACRNCQETYTEKLEELGHSYRESVVIREASYDQEGLRKRVCFHDSTHILEEIIPALETESSRKEEMTEETVQTDINSEREETKIEKTAKGMFNRLDLILSSINTIVCGLYIYFIRKDQYVLRWDRKRRELLKKRGG